MNKRSLVVVVVEKNRSHNTFSSISIQRVLVYKVAPTTIFWINKKNWISNKNWIWSKNNFKVKINSNFVVVKI